MKLRITKDFLFAHRGTDVVAYTAGQVIECDDSELLRVAMDEGWAAMAAASHPVEARETQAAHSAPEPARTPSRPSRKSRAT